MVGSSEIHSQFHFLETTGSTHCQQNPYCLIHTELNEHIIFNSEILLGYAKSQQNFLNYQKKSCKWLKDLVKWGIAMMMEMPSGCSSAVNPAERSIEHHCIEKYTLWEEFGEYPTPVLGRLISISEKLQKLGVFCPINTSKKSYLFGPAC